VATYDKNVKQKSMKDKLGMADRGVRNTKSKIRRMGDEPLVISASRRTDLVGCYPEALVERLEEFPSESVHSLVIWTKNPRNMIVEGALKNTLEKYRQIYIHLTITGMGGGEFEPMIPRWEEAVGMIGPLIDLVGDPRRISWRFDPILEIAGHGQTCNNFDLFLRLAEAIAAFGIGSCRISWVSPYKKVVARLARKGWYLVSRTPEERAHQANKLIQVGREQGMSFSFCCMEGLPISRCIDGELLNEIHPDGQRCSTDRAKGQRPLCGCTQSLDIGWYSLRCRHGCLYCYAVP
jgi:hypothetical protein